MHVKCRDLSGLTFQKERATLVADSMLQLPDAQRRKEQTFGAGKSAHCREVTDLVVLRAALSWSTPARFF